MSRQASCVSCHSTGKIVSALRLSGDATKDFRMLLKDGFFLQDDAGSVLARVTEKDLERRMPFMRKPWNESEIQILRTFTEDLNKKQRK